MYWSYEYKSLYNYELKMFIKKLFASVLLKYKNLYVAIFLSIKQNLWRTARNIVLNVWALTIKIEICMHFEQDTNFKISKNI